MLWDLAAPPLLRFCPVSPIKRAKKDRLWDGLGHLENDDLAERAGFEPAVGY
jgi:hypothetical protein